MELAATSPLLLWMLSDNHQVPADQVRLGLGALESWAIRRTLLRYTMKDVNKMMVTILKHLDSVPTNEAGTAVHNFLAHQTTETRLWPNDNEMTMHFPSTRVYGSIRQSRVRVILQAVELQLRNEKHEPVSLPQGLEIEHVMPQGWRTHWQPIPLSPDHAGRRDYRVNCIGNLTLLSKKLNGALSNRPWTDDETESLHDGGGEAGKGKRSLIEEYSLLALSKELILDHPQAWTDDDIDVRSRFLTGKICEIWPRPEATAP